MKNKPAANLCFLVFMSMFLALILVNVGNFYLKLTFIDILLGYKGILNVTLLVTRCFVIGVEPCAQRCCFCIREYLSC